MKETSVIETPGVDDIVRLDEMRPGEAGVIVDIDMSLKRNSRLVAMGVVPGTWIVVRKFAPLGDPMEIRLRNYQLSLRKSTASRVLVKRTRNNDSNQSYNKENGLIGRP